MNDDERKQIHEKAQEIYKVLLLDNRLNCTCDDYERETEFHHAYSHYHHCMLWQVAHAIERSIMYCEGYRVINGSWTKTSVNQKDMGNEQK